jgi:hypothetical protein
MQTNLFFSHVACRQQQAANYLDLPAEITELHRDCELERRARRSQADKRSLNLQTQLKREAAMVRMDCPARGKLWKLRQGGDKRKQEEWSRLLFVITYDGDMMHDNEEDFVGEPVLIGNLKNVVKHKVWDFALFPGGAVELVFRVKDAQGGRVVSYAYLGWKEDEKDDFEMWQFALKRFTWR